MILICSVLCSQNIALQTLNTLSKLYELSFRSFGLCLPECHLSLQIHHLITEVDIVAHKLLIFVEQIFAVNTFLASTRVRV